MSDDGAIAMFCSITGADESSAGHFLEAAGGSVEVAVGLFMDSNGKTPAAASSSSTTKPLEDEHVRQPIAPKRGVLIDDDTYGLGTRHWVDPRQLSQRSTGAAPFASFADTVDLTTERGRRLAQLFRTPAEIMFVGSFDGARKLAKSQCRYLLVSLHEPSEFACQMLNRDLWNQTDVQEFILDNLVYMQLAVGTDEADRYARFYPFTGHPHIDPRTGKAGKIWNRMPAPAELIGDIIEYAERHPLKAKQDLIVIDDDEEGCGAPTEPSQAVTTKQPVQQSPDETVPREVPAEPASDAPSVTTLQLRMPDSSRIKRRFVTDQNVASIFDFVSGTLQLPRSKFDILEHTRSLKELAGSSLADSGLRNASLNVTLL
jgi:hypothetical protein